METSKIVKVREVRGFRLAPVGHEKSSAVARSFRDAVADLALIGLFVLAMLWSLKMAAELVVPVIAAMVVGSVLARIGDRFMKIGIPPLAAALGLVGVFSVVVVLAGDALIEPLQAMIAGAPTMLRRLGEALEPLLKPLHGLKQSVARLAPEGAQPAVLQHSDMAWLTEFVSGLTPALGEVLVFLATLAFFVVGRATLRRNLILAFQKREARLSAIRVFNAVEGALALYFGTTALVYALTGAAIGIVAWAAGLPNPLLWFGLTFLASYIPYLGATVVTLALAGVGLAVHDMQIGLGLLPAAVFVGLHVACETAVMPTILGRRLELNPFVVFVAIVFWTWMWGPVGAVLAIPLLLVAKAILAEISSESGTLPE